ncbi:M48 family metallopeptidase [Actinotalea sp.]|uniref:M48 family metallopeptidase n=1 Tax=Actinotalea sp. TaxID=1872145 RepID=UPI0035615F88
MMDFQSRQQEAEQSTARLVALLVLGVVAITAVVTALLTGVLYYGTREIQPLTALAIAGPLTVLGIVGAALVKSAQISRGGGAYVAESLGGRRVDAGTADPGEQRLRHVVEEIALASGMPMPAVFVLDDEPSINAFAAGATPETAAIGVTRGALTHLDRRELQGVIGHEMSHVRNADTRITTRVIGWVFGIAAIAVLGRILLLGSWFTPRRRGRDGDAGVLLVVAGLGLVVVGAVGVLFARLVQAAVSRQREYLADASAVQYTRDPSALGDALIKIGALGAENRIRTVHATETSHLFFSTAVSTAFATHPPLEERIRRLRPDWDGTFPTLEVRVEAEKASAGGGRERPRPPAGQPFGPYLSPPPPGPGGRPDRRRDGT